MEKVTRVGGGLDGHSVGTVDALASFVPACIRDLAISISSPSSML